MSLRGEKTNMYRGTKIKISSDFSSQTKAKDNEMTSLKPQKKTNYQRTILYPAKITFTKRQNNSPPNKETKTCENSLPEVLHYKKC